jgi:hypothetical protein
VSSRVACRREAQELKGSRAVCGKEVQELKGSKAAEEKLKS